MPEVHGTALDAGSKPLGFATIRIALVTSSASTPGYTGAGEIVETYQTSADQTGAWTATLTGNSAITPANTYYTVTEGRGGVSAIVVPATGGPYEISELLVTPPPTPDAPGITGIQVGAGGTVAGVQPGINLIAGTNVTITAADNPSADRVDVTVNATGGGGGGAVDSVFDRTGNVVAQTGDYSADQISGLGTAATEDADAFDPAGAAATAQSNAETFATNAVAVETARAEAAEATKLTIADNLSDLNDASAARGHLGLGTAATQNTAAFDPAGAASTAQSNAIATAEANAASTYVPLSALPLPVASGGTGAGTAAGARTALGLGTAATADASAFDAAGSASTAQTNAISAAESNAAATYVPLSSLPLAIGSGGTGHNTQQSALTALAGAQTAGRYLRSDGTNTALAAIQAADVPTLNQSTTGTAGNVTGTVAIANGGTGQSGQQAAINALTGAQTAGRYLRSDGTNATLSAIQAGDVPTLNQSTSGTAAGLSATLSIGSGGTGQTSQQAAINALTGAQSAGTYLRSDGTNATLGAIQVGDVPQLNQNTSGTAAGLSATLAVGSGGTGANNAAGARANIGLTGSIPYSFDTPAQRGWVEWNYPPSLGVAVSQNFTSGSIYGISFVAQTSSSISKVGVQVVSSAGTPTAGQNMIGLYTIAGTTATQATVTGDIGTWSSAGFQSYALGASQTLVAGNTYLILFMSNASTAVHLQGITSDTAAQIGFLNLGLSSTAAPWLKFFVYGTAQTALPSSFTISGTTMSATNALAPWVCLL